MEAVLLGDDCHLPASSAPSDAMSMVRTLADFS